MKRAAENIIPSTTELGGKSPNIFFEDIMNQEEDYISKCAEGLVLAFFNQGEVCTCPSRAVIQESIYDDFISIVIDRAKQIKRGNPLDTETQVGAQASQMQFDKIMEYVDIGKKEGAEVLIGGEIEQLGAGFESGYYIQPTLMKGHNKMRIFQEEIFGPVVSVTTFKDEAEALAIANDTEFGLGAGLWTRDMNIAYRMGRGIEAGRVWTNCYHHYPAHAAFGGYKKSGVGRETHKMILEHYQQTKNLLVSYSTSPLGFF
jgi:aldehyde dehydrogenase